MIDFDEIWQKYSKYARIELVCFIFRVGLLFKPTFHLSNRTPKMTRILMLYQANASNFDEVQFFKTYLSS